MKGTQINIAPITCNLSHLTLFTTDSNAEPETILRQDEAFQVQVRVSFGGAGAIALMPLTIPIQVNFFADPYGCGAKIDLGNTIIETSAKTFTYTPTLAISAPAFVGLLPEEIYQITAVLRVGVINSPAFITGIMEGLAIQTYNP
jgi:hypothetical protein